jgi:hypothetical protein
VGSAAAQPGGAAAVARAWQGAGQAMQVGRGAAARLGLQLWCGDRLQMQDIAEAGIRPKFQTWLFLEAP